jgi:hypothetical protein
MKEYGFTRRMVVLFLLMTSMVIAQDTLHPDSFAFGITFTKSDHTSVLAITQYLSPHIWIYERLNDSYELSDTIESGRCHTFF